MPSVSSSSQGLLSDFRIFLSFVSHKQFSACSSFFQPSWCRNCSFSSPHFPFDGFGFLSPPPTLSHVCCSYGLLGPSGCGKTTLLKCIVGTLKISRGHITVLGKPPAFPGHEVPGKMVGYMPQVLQPGCFMKQHGRLCWPHSETWPAGRCGDVEAFFTLSTHLLRCLRLSSPTGPGVVQRVHHQRHLGVLRANPRADVEGEPGTHGFPHRLPGSTSEE